MPYYEIHLDRETSERAGAGGTFQVVSIENEEGNDVTDDLVDVGTHYASLDKVREAISRKLGVPLDTVDLDEV
ncbi:MAG: hypothetical protein EON58_01690 [Alphaproteobacteria bacterium]|nr:MAG: hypothetical protein EON58_01690 [Alphaproteobacteria bacterium]